MAIGVTGLSNSLTFGKNYISANGNDIVLGNTGPAGIKIWDISTGTYQYLAQMQGTNCNFGGGLSMNLPVGSTGLYNTGVGLNALSSNTQGRYNVALGAFSMGSSTTNTANTCCGYLSGSGMLSGSDNNSLYGYNIASNFASGSNNVVVGTSIPFVNVGSGNVYFGSSVNNAVNESNTMRLGGNGITRTFLNGVRGVSVSGGLTMQCDANGQLGTVVSAYRFKQNIRPLKDTSFIYNLHPVNFEYKPEFGNNDEQWGFIAETLMSDMGNDDWIVYDGDANYPPKGNVYSVSYDKLPIALLQEVQILNNTVIELKNSITDLQTQIDVLKTQARRVKVIKKKDNC